MARTISRYVTIYGAWIVSSALALLGFVAAREAVYDLAIRYVDKWAGSAVVNFATVIIGLVLLIATIFFESYYREGYGAGLLRKRFVKVSAYELGVIAVAGIIMLILTFAS